MTADEWEQELERDLERGSFWTAAETERRVGRLDDYESGRKHQWSRTTQSLLSEVEQRARMAEIRASEWQMIAEDNLRRAEQWQAAYLELAARQAAESLPWERRFLRLLGLTTATKT